MPAELASALGSAPDPLFVLVLQVVGALYAGMALLKFMFQYPGQPAILWGLCVVYYALAAWFGLTLFRHPLPAQPS